MEYVSMETPALEELVCLYELEERGLFTSRDERYFVGACQDGAPIGPLQEILCSPRERARIYRAWLWEDLDILRQILNPGRERQG